MIRNNMEVDEPHVEKISHGLEKENTIIVKKESWLKNILAKLKNLFK